VIRNRGRTLSVAINPVIPLPMLSRGNEVANRTNLLRRMSPKLARLRHANRPTGCLFIGAHRKSAAHPQNDVIDPVLTSDVPSNASQSRSVDCAKVTYEGKMVQYLNLY
jgi:hypothetical protein